MSQKLKVLTVKQIKKLASELFNTRDDVAGVLDGLFARPLEPDTIDRLRRDGHLFKCKSCGIWHSTLTGESAWTPGLCDTCDFTSGDA